MENEEVKTLKSAVDNLQASNLRLLQKVRIAEVQAEEKRQMLKVLQDQEMEYKKCIEEMEEVFELRTEEIGELKRQVLELKAEIYDLERRKE